MIKYEQLETALKIAHKVVLSEDLSAEHLEREIQKLRPGTTLSTAFMEGMLTVILLFVSDPGKSTNTFCLANLIYLELYDHAG